MKARAQDWSSGRSGFSLLGPVPSGAQGDEAVLDSLPRCCSQIVSMLMRVLSDRWAKPGVCVTEGAEAKGLTQGHTLSPVVQWESHLISSSH